MSDSKTQPGYNDPRIVALYDVYNLWSDDTDYYLGLADSLGAKTVVDLGCGTGLLTVALAEGGRRVVGVDPSAAMLQVARTRPGGELVSWVEGDVSSIEVADADLAIMSGHVAQVFADADEWQMVLAGLRGYLRPGGRIAFESRNPAAQAWLSWNPEETRDTVDTVDGPMESWHEVVDVSDGVVTFETSYRFLESGESFTEQSVLAFPTRDALETSLRDADFVVESVVGYWDGRLVDDASREFIVVARRP